MGDKSQKAKDKSKKQNAAHKEQERVAHDAKQAKPVVLPGKGK